MGGLTKHGQDARDTYRLLTPAERGTGTADGASPLFLSRNILRASELHTLQSAGSAGIEEGEVCYAGYAVVDKGEAGGIA